MNVEKNSILSPLPEISAGEIQTFKFLPLQNQLEIVLRARGKARLDYILFSDKPQQLVRALPELEVFWTVQQVGKRDALELLSLTTPQQFQCLVDLDVWKKDRLVPEKLLEWIEILMECGEEKFAEFIQSTDLELVIFLLKKFIHVTKEKKEPSEKEEETTPLCLDGLYFISWKEERAQELIQSFLEKVLSLDVDLYRRIMEGVIWELESGLEEDEYRWRNGRLADLGFPDFEEALEIYRFVNPQTVTLDGKTSFLKELPETARVPTFYLTFQENGPFFSTALRRMDDPWEQERIQVELAGLFNKAIVAESLPGFSAEEIERVGRKVFHTLNLGLQFLSEGKGAKPEDLLRSMSVQKIFQCGFGGTLLLKRKARALFQGPWFEGNRRNLSFLDSPHSEILKGFLKKRPALYREGGYSEFKDVEELKEMEHFLEMIAAVARFVIGSLGLSPQKLREMDWRDCHPNRWQDITFSTIFLTALGNRILKGVFLFQPIERSELPPLLSLLLEKKEEGQKRVKKEVRDLVCTGLTAATEDEEMKIPLQRFWDYCLRVLEEEYGSIYSEKVPDPRFMRGLVIRQ